MGYLRYIGIILFFLTLTGYSQNADFKADVVKGCDNLIVHFVDLSTGNPVSWLWNFGDGTATSALKNPTHYFTKPGKYTVTLTINTPTGSDIEIKNNFISIYFSPTADFFQNVSIGCPPFPVFFTDQSKPGESSVVSWLWDFGDGYTSSQQNISHTYTSTGNYNVSLYITDGNGCTSKKSKNNLIIVYSSPKASMQVANTTGCTIPHTVTISNTSTGQNLNYLWNFGDGTTSNLQQPGTHSYTVFGNYKLTLKVTNSSGCSDSVLKNINVNPLFADFKSDTTFGCAPATIKFTDLSTTGTTQWRWNFGDGSTSSIKNPSYQYKNPGIYTVTLIANSVPGCIDTIIKSDFITIYPKPTVQFTTDENSSCKVPFIVHFNDLTPKGSTWVWDLGNGNTSNLNNPLNTYTLPGKYTIKLTVTDSNNCSSTLTDSNRIQIVFPVAEFIDTTSTGQAKPYKGCKPLTVNFTDLSFSNEPISQWKWYFGDGSPVGNNQNPVHIYQDTGSYDVSLTIINNKGCRDSITRKNIVMVGKPPVVKFSPTDSTGCHPFKVEFKDLSSTYTDEWKWSFGSVLQHPTNTFSDTGYFDVILIAGFHGCYDTLKIDSAIYVLAPKPLFNASPLVGCNIPHTVVFTDQSKSPDAWTWRFGDGSPEENVKNTSHTYTNYGLYTAWLIVENYTTKCKDSISKTIIIPDIIPGFKQDTVIGCEPLIISFQDTSKTNTSLSKWKWDFGDGDIIGPGSGIITSPNTSGTYDKPVHTYLKSGIYTVKIFVTEQNNCQDSLIRQQLIEVKKLPSPGFETDTTVGCLPLTVKFSDKTVVPPSIISWLWKYGDGDSSTVQNPPPHTYTDTGQFTVTLKVTDTFNCTSSLTDTNAIIVSSPYPNFLFDTIICNHEKVTFTNLSKGNKMKFIWNYGDGTPSDTTFSFNSNHFFNLISDTSMKIPIKLTAIDSNGCTNQKQKTIFISIPSADFNVFIVDPNITCPPFPVVFNDLSSANAIKWLWDFGDKTNSSKVQNPSHTYSIPGFFDVRLIVTDQYNCSDTLVKDTLIRVKGPYGHFSYVKDSSKCNDTYLFKAITTDTKFITWIFGDGSEGSGDSIVHTYYTPGQFLLTLSLLDDKGCVVDIVDTNLIVVLPIDLKATFSNTNATCLYNDGTATIIPSDGTPPYNYLWENGQTLATADKLAAGTYMVTLTDSLKCVIFDSVTVNAVYPEIYLSFVLTNTKCNNDNGAATVVVDSGGVAPYSYFWSDSSKTNQITNLLSGEYFISISDSYGCTKKDSVTILNIENPIHADFITDTDNVYNYIPIVYTYTASDSSIIQWMWIFGDGDTLIDTTGTPVIHYFKYTGYYNTMLVITDSDGCRDSLSHHITIKEGMNIPNIFTPNGDGINDELTIYGSGMKTITMSIFDRWGIVMIQKTSSSFISWDGRTSAGVKVTSGIYYYLINAETAEGKKYENKGFFQVIY